MTPELRFPVLLVLILFLVPELASGQDTTPKIQAQTDFFQDENPCSPYNGQSTLCFGYLTDLHHSNVGRRRGDKAEPLRQVINYFNTLPLQFIAHGGDLIDRYTENVLEELRRIETIYQSGIHRGYHVLGNHDYDIPGGVDISKEQFFDHTSMKHEYYYLDRGNIRFLFLNANTEALKNHQFEWIERVIQETDKRLVAFSHQPIAGKAADDMNGVIHEIENIFSRHHNRFIAVFTGHRSAVTNTVDKVNGVLYFSMAHFFHEVPTYAVINLLDRADGVTLKLTGYGAQQSFHIATGGEPPFFESRH